MRKRDAAMRNHSPLSQELDDRRGIAATLFGLAELDRLQGNDAEARRGYEESLAINARTRWSPGIAVTLYCLAELDRLQGNYAEARRGYRGIPRHLSGSR